MCVKQQRKANYCMFYYIHKYLLATKCFLKANIVKAVLI